MEACTSIAYEETLSGLSPPPQSTGLSSDIVRRQKAGDLPVLVILDDDPTGTQTCHGINVLTVWDHDTLIEEFKSTNSGFFILTNSRALHTPEARDLIREICEAVKQAAAETRKDFELVLRGDSTLRGHFPDEPEVAEEVVGKADAWILAPFFRQGGRLTINDVHYVKEGEQLVPAAQTPFAKDASFGYQNSNLRKYVVEKSKGSISDDRVTSISLDDIRKGGSDAVTEKLLNLQKGSVIVVNAVVDEDMEVFMQGLMAARAQGKRYIYRTGAAFVSTRLGIDQIPPLTPQDLDMDISQSAPGGLIIAGSYVPKTTAQLESLVEGRGEKLTTITLQVEELLGSPEKTKETIRQAVAEAAMLISDGRDVLLMTSRELVTADDEASSLRIGAVIASALVDFLRMLEPRPRYIIAKVGYCTVFAFADAETDILQGGITSSDAAGKSLGMRRAEIAGQAASGVPLWRCHEKTSKFAGIRKLIGPPVGCTDTL